MNQHKPHLNGPLDGNGGKVVLQPKEVRILLWERRAFFTKFLIQHPVFRRFNGEIPDSKKEEVAREVFLKHKDDLKPYFYPRVKMMGGIVGEPMTDGVLEQLAKLKYDKWGAKDGNLKSVEDYYKVLKAHTGPTPNFVYFLPNGEVEGAVFPTQIHTRSITTWDGVTYNSTWKNDTLYGDAIVCPMICSYQREKRVGHDLIVGGVKPYANVLAYMRYIDDLLAYSRPMGYTEDKRSIPILDYLPKDPNYMGFHKRNGSKLVCVVEGGSSPLDACAGGYAFIMCYTTAMKPDKEFQAVLDKIGKSVMGMLVAG